MLAPAFGCVWIVGNQASTTSSTNEAALADFVCVGSARSHMQVLLEEAIKAIGRVFQFGSEKADFIHHVLPPEESAAGTAGGVNCPSSRGRTRF